MPCQFLVVAIRLGPVLGFRRPEDQRLARHAVHFDVGNVVLNELVLRDLLAVLPAALRILDHLGQAILNDAEATCCDTEPPTHERTHRDAEALAFGTEHVLRRHEYVLHREHGRVRGRHPHLGVG